MKKILFVIPTMRMGGAEKSLVNLLNSMDLKDREVDLILFEKDGELLDGIPKEVNVIEADFYVRAMMLEFRFYFKQLLKTKNVFAIIARIMILINSRIQEKTNFRLFFSWALARKFIKKQKKVYDVAISYLEGAANYYVMDKVTAHRKIAWIHTDISIQKRNFKKEKVYYDAVEKIITVSEKCRKQFVKCYPELDNKVLMIENMSNPELIIQKSEEAVPESFKGKEFCIVTIGRLETVKGIDIAFEAAKILRNKGIDFKWHIFGEGSLRKELEALIEKESMQDIFILEGVTNNPYRYMRVADVVVQPSRYEGKSIVLDEAKILGKAIVVTRYTSVADQIEDGRTGVIVDISSEAIAEGIERVATDSDLKMSIEEACRQSESIADKVLKAVYDIID